MKSPAGKCGVDKGQSVNQFRAAATAPHHATPLVANVIRDLKFSLHHHVRRSSLASASRLITSVPAEKFRAVRSARELRVVRRVRGQPRHLRSKCTLGI